MLVINPNVELRINTNLSIVNNEIYKLIQKFKNVHWTISVDNMGKDFEYLRYGGEWDTFVKNLKILSEDFNTINFNAVWCVLNSKSVFDCIDYLVNTLGYHENTIIVNPLEMPLWLDVNNLPEPYLDTLRDELRRRISQANPHYCLYNSLYLMLKYIDKPNFVKNLQASVVELEKIDQRRNLNSKLIFPEIYQCSK